MYYIIKFGMIKRYPNLKKHLEDKLTDPDQELLNAQTPKEKQIAEIKKLIEQIAMSRHEQALRLIDGYHEKQIKAVSVQGESVKISVEKHEKLYGIDEAPGADAPYGAPLKANSNQIGFEPDRNQIPAGQIFKTGDGGRGGGPEQQILLPGNSRMEVDVSMEHNAANAGRIAEAAPDKFELIEDSDALRY